MIGLPELFGSPIFVSAQPDLRAHRGRLLSGSKLVGKGTAVHAASFIRKREIVLETQLLARTSHLRLILVHEIFHFVWTRLSNADRASFRRMIEAELQARARGEMGESAEVNKSALLEAKMRDYVCESFCDTAAWLFAGVRNSGTWTMAQRWRTRRRLWFGELFDTPRPC